MGPILPVDLLITLNGLSPCRELQLRQLATIYNSTFPSPSTCVVYGLESTGKCSAVTSVLEAQSIPFGLVKCRECLSQRHFLSKAFGACVAALGKAELVEEYGRVDNLNTLAVNLEKLLRDRTEEKFVLVFDGMDRQRGSSPTLLAALARLGEVISNLSIIFISASPRPLPLHISGVPYVHFPPYTRAEAIHLVTATPHSLVPPNDTPSVVQKPNEALSKWYAQFAEAVYDSLIISTSSSLSSFRSACEKLWPRFIWPYLSGESPPGKAKTWDFAKLLLRNRGLFQTDGEMVLEKRLQPLVMPTTFREIANAGLNAAAGTDAAAGTVITSQQKEVSSYTPPKATSLTTITTTSQTPLLRYFSTLLLASAYLASHTAPKLDILLFSRLSSGSKSHKMKKNYHRRKLFQSGSTGTSSKKTSKSAAENSKIYTRKSSLDVRLGVARPFSLERVTAILRAIHPQGVAGRKSIADKVYRHLAELERLRLVLPVGGGGGDGGAALTGDNGDEERWTVNLSRAWVEDMAGRWDFGFRDYEVGNA